MSIDLTKEEGEEDYCFLSPGEENAQRTTIMAFARNKLNSGGGDPCKRSKLGEEEPSTPPEQAACFPSSEQHHQHQHQHQQQPSSDQTQPQIPAPNPHASNDLLGMLRLEREARQRQRQQTSVSGQEERGGREGQSSGRSSGQEEGGTGGGPSASHQTTNKEPRVVQMKRKRHASPEKPSSTSNSHVTVTILTYNVW